MDNYKLTEEWQSLSNIWKKSGAEVREECNNDFKKLCELIKKVYCKRDSSDYSYLSALTDEAFNYVVSLINMGEKNMYHSMMAILDNHEFSSLSDFCNYYVERNSVLRPQWRVNENRPYIEELSKICYTKYNMKKKH